MLLKFHGQKSPQNFQRSHPKNTFQVLFSRLFWCVWCCRFLSLWNFTPLTFTTPYGPGFPCSADRFLSVSFRRPSSLHSLSKCCFSGFCPWPSSQLNLVILHGWPRGVSTSHMQMTLKSLFPLRSGLCSQLLAGQLNLDILRALQVQCSNSICDSTLKPEILCLSWLYFHHSPDRPN